MMKHQLPPSCIIAFLIVIMSPTASIALPPNTEIKLQTPHPTLTPQQTLETLAKQCAELGATNWDVYGDFEDSQSYLRRFEAEVAQEFQKEDAIFMPSGVMAQSIALLIHSQRTKKQRFICHATSHLILHEQNSFRELCNLEAITLGQLGLGASALGFEQVQECLQREGNQISTILLELPHRELGGKLTPWAEIIKMQQLARTEGVAFHCDGARIFEATAGYDMSVEDLAKPFDSIYISFYKGLGGISGAMLLGTKDFCKEARIWLRRFGGNLYTLLPYAISGWTGYRRYWVAPSQQQQQKISHDTLTPMSFADKKHKLVKLARAFCSNEVLSQFVTLEPSTPEVNMVHFYLRLTVPKAETIRDKVQSEMGVVLFHRIRAIDQSDPAFDNGYRSKFELAIGEANGSIPNDVWINAWEKFGHAASLIKETKQTL
jgi:threonine aldolase